MSARAIYRRMADSFQTDREQVITEFRRRKPKLEESSPRPIRLAPVRTYVGDGKTLSFGSFPGVVVPPFATHWGVLIGRTLYHLTFRDDDDARIEFNDCMGKGKPIQFTITLSSPEKVEKSPVVGETKYDHETLVAIGEALIHSFGSYHRLFWNCQVYAECFLCLITGGNSFIE